MMNGNKKKLLISLLILIVLIPAILFGYRHWTDQKETVQPQPVSEVTDELPAIETDISYIDDFGNMILSIKPETMMDLGYETADIVSVKIDEYEVQMPICTSYSDVDSFEPLCLYRTYPDGRLMTIVAINAGNMAETAGIATRSIIDEDPGFEWHYKEGYDKSVSISLVNKQGYKEEYLARSLPVISTKRSDYPDLDDWQYANFRAVNGGELGKDVLFRSVSPIDDYLNRDKEADAAAREAGIKTILNLSENEALMLNHPGFQQKYYSQCDIIAFNLPVDLVSDEFKEDLAACYRFMIDHPGPYLIHCNEGKDRTGYVVAILESLMGVSAKEIADDYMETFVVLYRVKPDTDQYRIIAERNIEGSLAKVFNIDSIYAENVDLKECAETYLLSIGFSDEEIKNLKDSLSKDYSGLSE